MLCVEILDLFDYFIAQESHTIEALENATKKSIANKESKDRLYQLGVRQTDHMEMKNNLEELRRLYERKHDK